MNVESSQRGSPEIPYEVQNPVARRPEREEDLLWWVDLIERTGLNGSR